MARRMEVQNRGVVFALSRAALRAGDLRGEIDGMIPCFEFALQKSAESEIVLGNKNPHGNSSGRGELQQLLREVSSQRE